jgi:sulfite exporter TauE/SafE
MLASDIMCLVFLGIACLVLLLAIGIWVDWVWNRRISRFHIIAGCIILFIVMVIIAWTIISLAVIL